MPTQRVVIEFVGDTTELQPAIDELTSLGKIDQKSADAFKATTKAIGDRKAELDKLAVSQNKQNSRVVDASNKYEAFAKSIQNVNKQLFTGASSELLKGFFEGVGDAIKDTGLSMDDFLDRFTQGFTEGGIVPTAGEKVQSVVSKLKDLKKQLAAIGPEDARFKEIAAEAAILQDKVDKVGQTVKNLSSDTKTLDGVIGSIQGITGAFQIAQGSAALFGDSSEELQQTLVRLTALMNIANGLQGIQNLLQKQSSAVLLVTNAQMKIKNLQIAAENALESKNVVVKGLATAAQWALNAAQAASPQGLLAAGLLAVGAALLYFTRTTETATEAQKRFNDEQLLNLETLRAIDDQLTATSNARIKILENELAVAQSRGASALELAKIEKKIADERVAQAIASQVLFEKETRGINSLRDDYQKLIDKIKFLKTQTEEGFFGDTALVDNKEQLEVLESQLKVVEKRIAEEERLRDARLKAVSGQLIAQQNLAKAERKAAVDDLEDQKAIIQRKLIEVKRGTDEELQLKIDLVNTQARIDTLSLEGTKNTEAQRKLITAKALEEIRVLRLEQSKAILEEQKAAIQAAILESKKGSAEQNQLKFALVQTEKKIADVSLEIVKAGEAEKQLAYQESADKIKQIKRSITEEDFIKLEKLFSVDKNVLDAEISKLETALADLDKLAIDSETDQDKRATLILERNIKVAEQTLEIRKSVIEANADAEKLAAQKTFELSEKNVEDQKLFASEILRIDQDKIQQQKDAEQELADLKAKLRQQELEEWEAVYRQLVSTAIQAAGEIADNSIEREQASIQANLDASLEAIEKEKNAELKNKNLTESQKEQVEEKYRRREAEAKLAAWEATQNSLVAQAEMQMALAALNALASVPYPANIAAVAAVLAFGAIQIANIEKQEPPAFAKGEEYVKGPGTKYSDSIYARLSRGERVVDADTNEAFFPTLHAIHTGKVDADYANAVIAGKGKDLAPIHTNLPSMPKATRELAEQAITMQFGGDKIDSKELARAIAEAQSSDFEDLIQSVNDSDNSNASLLMGLHNILSTRQTANLRRR